MGFLTDIAKKVAGPAIGGLFGLGGSALTASKSQASADKQMDFQERMSNTGYQRAMADMEKAGLNPVLAARLGPASTPGGAMANVPDFGQAISGGMNAGSTAQTQLVQRDKLEEEVVLVAQQYDLTRAQTMKIDQEVRNLKAEYDKIVQQTALTKEQTALTDVQAWMEEELKRILTEMNVDGAVGAAIKLMSIIKGGR